jgi:hypothetical protein
MTARRAFLSNFWVGTKGGLLTAKHINRMGSAIWLFQYLLRGQTSVNQHGVGVFQYGHPITLEQIAFDMAEGEDTVPVRTIRKWVARLRRAGYISTEQHSSKGVQFWIANAKDKTKKPRTVTPDVSTNVHCGQDKLPSQKGRESIKLPSQKGRKSENSRPFSVTEILQSVQNQYFPAPIPKGFTPKSLSYYNKHAATPEISVPESQKQTLEATPSLQEQTEKLRTLHPEWFGKAGQAATERREATA